MLFSFSTFLFFRFLFWCRQILAFIAVRVLYCWVTSSISFLVQFNFHGAVCASFPGRRLGPGIHSIWQSFRCSHINSEWSVAELWGETLKQLCIVLSRTWHQIWKRMKQISCTACSRNLMKMLISMSWWIQTANDSCSYHKNLWAWLVCFRKKGQRPVRHNFLLVA